VSRNSTLPRMMAMSDEPLSSQAGHSLKVYHLTNDDEGEVLRFLSARPIQTVMLAGFARVHGLVSHLNRGFFYACRDAQGNLEGVALMGHCTLMETRSEAALAAFARLAQSDPGIQVISGEQEKIRDFWAYFTAGEPVPHLLCHSLLFELHSPVEMLAEVKGLRLATPDDFDLVVTAHAEVIRDELGVDPLGRDAEGFRRRCAQRISQGHQWVWIEDGRLIFKADIAADTPEVIYLEGVYVHPAERGKNYGLRCVLQLSRNLLERAETICLLVDEHNLKAQALYRKAGYRFRCWCDTIYLQ
jgi:uncharacterized protein